jgi:hypothetical protein
VILHHFRKESAMQAREFIKCFMPQVTNASWTEKLRSGLAGGVAILILGWLLHALPLILM